MMTDEELDEFLEHHGVRGMRWGQRKKKLTSSQKVVRNQHRAEIALKAYAGSAAVAVVAIHMDQHPENYIAAGKFINEHAKTSAKLAIKAAKGASILFKKDSMVFSPGTFVPGQFVNAGPQALTVGLKAIGVG